MQAEAIAPGEAFLSDRYRFIPSRNKFLDLRHPLREHYGEWTLQAFTPYETIAQLTERTETLEQRLPELLALLSPEAPGSADYKAFHLIQWLDDWDASLSWVNWSRGALEAAVLYFRPLTFNPQAFNNYDAESHQLFIRHQQMHLQLAYALLNSNIVSALDGTPYEHFVKEMVSEQFSEDLRLRLAEWHQAIRTQRQEARTALRDMDAAAPTEQQMGNLMAMLGQAMEIRATMLELEGVTDLKHYFCKQNDIPLEALNAMFLAAAKNGPFLLEQLNDLTSHPGLEDALDVPYDTHGYSRVVMHVLTRALSGMPKEFTSMLTRVFDERWVMLLNEAALINPDVVSEDDVAKAEIAFKIHRGFDRSKGEMLSQEEIEALRKELPDYERYLFNLDTTTIYLGSYAAAPLGRPVARVLSKAGHGRPQDVIETGHEISHAIAHALATLNTQLSTEDEAPLPVHEFFAAFIEYLILDFYRIYALPEEQFAIDYEMIGREIEQMIGHIADMHWESELTRRYMEQQATGTPDVIFQNPIALIELYKSIYQTFGFRHLDDVENLPRQVYIAVNRLLTEPVADGLQYSVARVAARTLFASCTNAAQEKGDALVNVMKRGGTIGFAEAMEIMGVQLDAVSLTSGLEHLNRQIKKAIVLINDLFRIHTDMLIELFHSNRADGYDDHLDAFGISYRVRIPPYHTTQIERRLAVADEMFRNSVERMIGDFHVQRAQREGVDLTTLLYSEAVSQPGPYSVGQGVA